jgi:hypothetical protein
MLVFPESDSGKPCQEADFTGPFFEKFHFVVQQLSFNT